MNRRHRSARANRPAATAMEFGMIVALLSAVAIFSALDLGNKVSTTFTDMVWNLKAS